jgi:hypothetical protein
MKLLQLVYNAAETDGQVYCTPSKERPTYKLESPVGVNANLLTRNFSAMEASQDGQEEENDNAVENVQAENQEDFGQRIRGVGSFWEARFETKHVKRDERDLARAV